MALALDTGVDADTVDARGAPGAVFGPYRLIEKIGEGGMGIVWLARQEHPIRRDVALKQVRPGADSAQVLLRFESERQALAILNHPNIATVFDAGLSDDGRPYFVMEYVRGGLPITAFADRHALPIAARLELFLQVCGAVEHAHQKGVLHRDLKPANILVSDRDGAAIVKVIDFGVAKAIGPSLSMEAMETQVGSLVGTPEYMSPEQAGLTQAAVDTRTDIYSLGLVLYELLVGALPFDASELRRKAVLEMLRVIREDDPPALASRLSHRSDAELREIAKRRVTDPRALVRQLRGDLEWITNRALEKEPARRYASASELGTDVRRHLANEPVSAGPPTFQYRFGKLIHRHRAAAAAAGVALAALVLSAAVSAAMWIRAETARADTRRQLAASLAARGVARLDAWDWAGGLLSFVKAMEVDPDRRRDREHRIRIAEVLDRMPRLARFWPHGVRVSSVDLSQQGIVASGGTDGAVRLWSIRTGQPIGAPLQQGGAINRVVFSPDGLLVASASDDGTARVIRASTGEIVGQPLRHEGAVHDVVFSPDSQVLATAGADRRAMLWRLGEDKPYARLDMSAPLRRIVFTRDGTRLAASAATNRDRQPFEVRVWSTKDGTPAGEPIRGEPDWWLTDMDFDPNGRHVVTSGNQGCHCARLWNATTGELVGSPMTHRNAVPTVRFNASGTQVVTGGFDRVVQVWNVPQGEAAAPSWTITGWPESVRFGANGELIASTVNGAVEVARAGSGAGRESTRIFPTMAHAGPVNSATFDATGRFLVTGSSDGAVRVWDVAPALQAYAPYVSYSSPWVDEIVFAGGKLAAAQRIFDTTSGLPVVPPLRVESQDFFSAMSNDGRRIAIAGSQSVRVWDATTGEPISPVMTHNGRFWYLSPLAFSPDGRLLLTLGNRGGSLGEAVVWDIATAKPAITLKHGANVTSGAFSPDGSRLMTGSAERDTNLRIWAIDGGALLFAGHHPEGVFAGRFAHANDRIVTVGFDQRVLEWRIGSTLTSSQVAELHSEPTQLAIGRDRTLVAGGRGGDIRARAVRSGVEWTTNMQQTGAVMAADVSPDDEWVVTSGDDGYAHLWNLRSGERLSPAYRLGGPVYAVKFAPNGASFGIAADGVYLRALAPDQRSMGQLADLAELLSARRLVNAGDQPLQLDEMIARWNRLTSIEPPAIDSVPPAWHRRRASLALFEGNAPLALDHFSSVRTAAGRLSWTDTMMALAALAKAGRWTDAVKEVERLDAARDGAPELSFVEAVARRRSGERSAPLAACRDLLARHAATANPDRALWILRTCLLDPDARTLPDWSATARLLEPLIDLPSFGTRESLAGAVAVRAGRIDDAIELLQRAAAGKEATPHTMMFLSMALARARKIGDARNWLDKSTTFVWPIDRAFSQKIFRDAWFDAEAAILREEVQRILDDPSVSATRK
jgi:WD40 repeat protein/serine/threonine protein kinase